MVNVISCNVNGLRNKMTRRALFREMNKLNLDICVIQESFVTDDIVKEYKKDWAGEFIYTEGTVHSLGNLLLFKKSFDMSNFDVIHKSKRIICLTFKYDNEQYMIINVYFPNDTNGKYKTFQDLSILLDTYYKSEMNLLLAGDFNCTINSKLDIVSGNEHPAREVENFNEFVNKYDLFDLWRIHNYDTKDFTWRHKKDQL